MTLWEGRQDFWKCKNYEVSDEYVALIKQFYEASDKTDV